MNPRIPHHKVVIVNCVRLNYIWEWSIRYCSLSTMFYPLHSSTNQELSEKHVCNHKSHYENTMVARAPRTVWNWSIHCPPLSAMFDSLHSSTNQELFKKYVCNHRSRYEKYDGGACPTYRLKLKYLYPFFVSYFWLVTQQYESRSVWKVPI